MTYAGFWRRFGACLLDIACVLPLSGLEFWGSSHYRLFDLYNFFPSLLFGFFYNVYLVQRFGGTPGKLLTGLRIRKVDGQAIGYREAILRYLPEAFLSALLSIGLIEAIYAMTDSEYLSLDFMHRSQRLVELAPTWYSNVNIALQVWIWSEFIVMLTNKKRRAPHDFIAGTIVIVNEPGTSTQAADQATARPAGSW